MSKFFYNIADENACFLIHCKILVTRDTITNSSIGWLQTRHDRLVWIKILSVNWERKFAYLFLNDQWKLSRNKGKRVLKSTIPTCGVVVEYGLDLLKRCLCFARRNPENLFFCEDDCHPTLTLYSFTNNGWSLRLLEKTWQQLFLWVINLCLLV